VQEHKVSRVRHPRSRIPRREVGAIGPRAGCRVPPRCVWPREARYSRRSPVVVTTRTCPGWKRWRWVRSGSGGAG